MATIPKYERKYAPSGALNAPRQNFNVPANAFRSPLAGAVESAAPILDAIGKNALRQKKEKDEAWVSSALASLSNQIDDYTFGTEENPGVYSQKGINATGATKAGREYIEKLIDDISANATSEEAARLFTEKSFSIRTSTSRSIARHESAETAAWVLQTKADNAVAQMNRIASNYMWSTYEISKEFNSTVTSDLAELANKKGIPAKQFIADQKAKLYSDIITQRIASGNIKSAQAAFDAFNKELTADQRPRLTEAIMNKEAQLDGQRLAETLFHDPTVTYKQAMDKIMGVENPVMRQHARSLYNAYRYNQKQIETEEFNDKTNDIYSKIDQMVGDLVNQQRLVDTMPEETPTQRKVKDKAKARLAHYKNAKGIKPQTDPATYDSAVEAIIYADVTDAKALRAQFGDKIEEQDIKDLETLLSKSQKSTAESIRTAYSFAIGENGEPDVKLSDSEKRDRGAFILWAQQMLKDTNRAQDEGYIQKLADKWVLEGERKRAFTPGYGKDVTLGEAVRTGKIETWLPDTPDEGVENSIKLLFKQYPDVHQKWLDVYDGDEELAIRAYYKELLLQDIGPRKR